MGGGSVRPKNLKCVKLYWNFQRGGEGGLKKNPFCRGGIDIYWNYTLEVLNFCSKFDIPSNNEKISQNAQQRPSTSQFQCWCSQLCLIKDSTFSSKTPDIYFKSLLLLASNRPLVA